MCVSVCVCYILSKYSCYVHTAFQCDAGVEERGLRKKAGQRMGQRAVTHSKVVVGGDSQGAGRWHVTIVTA